MFCLLYTFLIDTKFKFNFYWIENYFASTELLIMNAICTFIYSIIYYTIHILKLFVHDVSCNY